MKSHEVRQAFLDYFASKDHTIVESAPLVPDNDPTLLFTNAGMVQFKEALALREKRGYTRAASCQRCVRAGGKHNDLDNVGYTARHHTFFEMLGNFSFGDYFKEEAITYAWEFMTEVLGIPADKLWVTIHTDDDEAEAIWVDAIGFDRNRITRLGDEANFWTMGDTGPCGPCTEIFYDHGEEVPGGPPGTEGEDLDRFVEIWNLVFTQYDRSADGTLTPLPRPCVDTGMGLERLVSVLQGVHDNYETDLLKELVDAAGDLLNVRDRNVPSLKVIADHIRSSVFLISDGVLPSNEGRGYVLRRIIRRALRHGHKLQSTGPFFHQLVEPVVRQMQEAYPMLAQTRQQVEKVLLKEEQQFELTLDQGMRILGDAIEGLEGSEIPGDVVFKLYDTYGFPVDLTADIARERNLTLDMEGFEQAMEAQRQRARAASKFGTVDYGNLDLDIESEFVGYDTLTTRGRVMAILQGEETRETTDEGDEAVIVLDRTPFYAESGGQAGDTGRLYANGVTFEVLDTVKEDAAVLHRGKVIEGRVTVGDELEAEVDRRLRDATRLNHSATHLLHAALKKVLGDHVNQRGSVVDPERLRFDFSHFQPLTPDEIRAIERMVNEEIRRNTEVRTEVMDLETARKQGAVALFGEKYSEQVRVLTMGEGFSVELCGGTHASRTGDIGILRIVSEQGIASGVRRIEALTGRKALEYVEEMEDVVADTAALLKIDRSQVAERVKSLLETNRQLEREITRLNTKLASGGGNDLADSAIEIGGIKVVAHTLEGADPKTLPDAMDRVKNKIQSGVVLLATVSDGKVSLIAGVTGNLTDRINAGELVNHVAVQIGGKGGGRPDMARAGGTDVDALPGAMESVPAYIESKL